MNSPTAGARITAVFGGAALIAMAALLSSCSKNETPAPAPSTSTSTVVTTTSPPATPTEKVLSPTDGNKFSPTVMAPPAPTESGGNHHHGINGTS